MKDRIVEHPNRYMVVPVDGADSLVDLIPAPGEIVEEGTPLNKATLLSDGTAAMLGLTSADPTVDEALRALKNAIPVRSKQLVTEIITTSQVWTPPHNVWTEDSTSPNFPITVRLFGGGGGGYFGGYNNGGGGGGGGAMSYGVYSIASNKSYNITIGQGGLDSANGGTTSFGTIAAAIGGGAGLNGAGGSGGSGGGGGGNNSTSNSAERSGGIL